MKRLWLHIIILIVSLCLSTLPCKAEDKTREHLDSLAVQINGKDTLFLAFLHDVYIFPPMRFKSKKQEKFYWRTVRDVKKTLPIAKILNKEMIKTDQVMSRMSKREQRKFWKQYERVLYDQYENQFRQMTAAQGQMLMKLIDRESGRTSYDVIKYYKGSFVANFWQGIAKMVGNNLKEEYDGNDKDKITERIILLVEAGQL